MKVPPIVDDGRLVRIAATLPARRLLNLQMFHRMAAVGSALEDRRAGRYGPVPELEEAPSFVATPSPQKSSGRAVAFEAIIDA
jgi:hypothetical protein